MRSKTYNGKGSNKKGWKDKKVNSKGRKSDDKLLNSSERDNDPNWYFTSPELANQAAQLSFQSMLGFGSLYGYKVPSIARIDTVMNPGVTYKVRNAMHWNFDAYGTATIESIGGIETGKAAVNLMAAKLYTTLSSFTGRTASYAPQDVAMMILQISSIAEISEAIRRAFGVALTYNTRNRAVPLGLIRSMGIDEDDFVANLSIYRMRFNVAMSRINQIPLLENIAFIKKARDVYQRIYMDDPTNMSQLFYYMPAYSFVLDEVGDADGSILRAKQFTAANGAARSMASLLQDLEAMITAALESSTLNFIYADLLNMANKLSVQTWQFDYLAENYIVMPEYNANALLQFHNVTVMGLPDEIVDPNNVNTEVKAKITSITGRDVYVTSGASVFCDANANDIVYNPPFDASRCNQFKWFVDMPSDNPSVEDRIESIRYAGSNTGNIIIPTSVDTTKATVYHNAYVFNVLPDHYARDIMLFDNITLKDNNAQGLLLDRNLVIITSGNLPNTAALQAAEASQFEHFPILATVEYQNTTALNRIFGGLQYFTEYDFQYASRLMDIMMVGLWDFRVK